MLSKRRSSRINARKIGNYKFIRRIYPSWTRLLSVLTLFDMSGTTLGVLTLVRGGESTIGDAGRLGRAKIDINVIISKNNGYQRELLKAGAKGGERKRRENSRDG
jgi:hypothetical protein